MGRGNSQRVQRAQLFIGFGAGVCFYVTGLGKFVRSTPYELRTSVKTTTPIRR